MYSLVVFSSLCQAHFAVQWPVELQLLKIAFVLYKSDEVNDGG